MANEIIFSSGIKENEPMYGKYLHPIRGFIEDEADRQESQQAVLNKLFNIEKSNRYAETIMGESNFSTFAAKAEGAKAEYDTVQRTFEKTIEHVEYGKTFRITRKMVDDSKFGIATEMKARPREFVRAYYKTKHDVAVKAIINGKAASMQYPGVGEAGINLTTGDGKPLFSSQHQFSSLPDLKGQTQSNLFYGDISSSEEKFEIALNTMMNKVRNFKNENGEALGYVANVLIIPGNRPVLEMWARRLCGSELNPSTSKNAINTQFGNWALIIIPEWQADADEIIVMSSEANENLLANMFYNRVGLDMRNWIDEETRDLLWNGYCRFGVGFTTWKHIARCTHSTDAVSGATDLFA